MPDAALSVPFLAVNTDTIEWDDNVTLFQLPTGAHKIHPNLKIKVLMRDDVRGQGVGKALVARLIEDATAKGMRQMIAVIGDSENIGSIGVHASLGFQMVGTLRAVGVKFGRWVDVGYWELAYA